MSLSSTVTAIYLAIPEPGTGIEPPGVGADINTMVGWVAWCAFAACVAGLLIAGAKAAIARRHQEEFNFSGVAMPLIAAGIISAAAGLINVVAS